MISSVVVSYQVRPEAVAEHVRLIEAVFEQLRAQQPDNVEYKVMRLADGVSFVHVSSADTPDGSNPLPVFVPPSRLYISESQGCGASLVTSARIACRRYRRTNPHGRYRGD